MPQTTFHAALTSDSLERAKLLGQGLSACPPPSVTQAPCSPENSAWEARAGGVPAEFCGRAASPNTDL